MAHFHVKKKKGRPYLYVREIARVDGKPKVISQIYIGSPEKVAAMAGGQKQELSKGSRKPTRRLETPSKTQAEVLSVFGHQIDASGVLQNI